MPASDKLCQQLATATQVAKNIYSPISHVQAAQLGAAQATDAAGYAQLALATLFEAIYGICVERYVWATIKLYYSAFYSIRSRLLLKGCSIFYIGHTPHFIWSQPGQMVSKQSGNTHSVVFRIFNSHFQSDALLSQPIDTLNPLEWLEERRNTASYKIAPSSDPLAWLEFSKIQGKVRTHIQAYFDDKTYMYAFDKDHAIVSFPIEALKATSADLSNKQIEVNIDKHFIDIVVNQGCFVPEIKTLKSFIFP
jgi:uncharacterized protein (UPF0332 family)